MSQKTKVVGSRTSIIWFLIVVALLVAAGVALVVFLFLPQRDAAQHYQAGLAFENTGEWEAARQEYMQVIGIDPAYKDAQTRLAEVKARLDDSAATATSEVIAQAEQARVDAESTAAAQAQAAQTAQFAAVTATVVELEAQYQRGLGYINLEKWQEAQAELEQVFAVDPNYKDVQAQLALVNVELAALTPSATSTPLAPITPTPTATPSPTQTPNWVIFQDNFDDGGAEGWLPVDGSWNVVEGRYVCVDIGDARSVIGEEDWTDYAVTADVQVFSGPVNVSVLGRLQDAEHYYMAQFRDGHAFIYRRQGRWVQLASVPYSAVRGTWYRIRLQFQGTRISMYVNDVQVTAAEDAVYLHGKVGLRCADNAQAYFDNVEVTLVEKR